MQTDLIIDHIVQWLTEYLDTSNLNGFVIGVSGGIDSAVTSTLCAKTGRHTTLLNMPIHQAPDQLSRSSNHIAYLNEAFKNTEGLNPCVNA